MGDLRWTGASEQAELLARGEVSGEELRDAAIVACDELDPGLHFLVAPLYERAPPGVPMLLKDAGQELAGTPHHVGLAALRDAGHRSPATTELAARFEAVGFSIVGKAACPPLANGVTTEPPGFEPTRNPWDPTRSAGGSSGGSAAAVACGAVPVAHGSDATGSLRCPAALCGLVTLNPTAGLIPAVPPAGQPADGAWRDFVVAREARDLRFVFERVTATGATGVGAPVVAPGTGGSAPVGARGTGRSGRRPGPGARGLRSGARGGTGARGTGVPGGRAGAGLRVGLLDHDPEMGLPVDPACAAGVAVAGALLERLGHHVEPGWPSELDAFWRATARAFAVVSDATRPPMVAWVGERLGRPVRPGELDGAVFEAAARAATRTPADVAAARRTIDAALAGVVAWWGAYDLLVTPATFQPAWPLGGNPGPRELGTLAAPFSLSGQPALAVPVHWTDGGLPVGVQVVGGHGADDLLLDLACDLQEAQDWTVRRPSTAR